MKKDIHPENYRPVIFLDTSSGERFLLSSTVETKEAAEWEDGEEYPLAKVEMSSASHPFYTGVEKVVDTAGRVEKFQARFKKSKAATSNQDEAVKEEATDDAQDEAEEEKTTDEAQDEASES